MSNTPTRCIALTKELDAYIRTRVASGHFTSASEVVRAALRLLIERDATTLGSRSPLDRSEPLRGTGTSTP